MEGLKIIVLAKQVPDTRNVGKDAMKANGTVNRAALSAIFNPEDLKALEQALRLKEMVPDSTVTLITMGPVRAANIIREALYRGADNGILITDKRFAGSDTLATSYALSLAVAKTGKYDIILCGRQAIDGDTAQVGPQVAEKLNIPQITYVEEILKVNKSKIQVKRRLENGVETLEAPFPLLATAHGSAPDCRNRNSKLLMKFKHACTHTELVNQAEDYISLHDIHPYLDITEWNVDDLDADVSWLGLSGSPTKVEKVENIIFMVKESVSVKANKEGIDQFMRELIENHNIG